MISLLNLDELSKIFQLDPPILEFRFALDNQIQVNKMDVLKAAGDFADGLLDLFNRTAKKLESPGRDLARDSVLGSLGEISGTIERGSQGEVSVILSGSLQHYPARALRPDQKFDKGSKVRIADVGTNLLYVESCLAQPASQRIEVIE